MKLRKYCKCQIKTDITCFNYFKLVGTKSPTVSVTKSFAPFEFNLCVWSTGRDGHDIPGCLPVWVINNIQKTISHAAILTSCVMLSVNLFLYIRRICPCRKWANQTHPCNPWLFWTNHVKGTSATVWVYPYLHSFTLQTNYTAEMCWRQFQSKLVNSSTSS